MPRTYDNSRRSRLAAETTERIAEMTEILLAGRPIGEVTLQAIADGAGVSVQTVLRHYGSREGCIEAAGKRMLARIDGQRGRTSPGEIDSALVTLLDHYEAEGRLILHLLAQEEMDVTARSAVQQGRTYHRAWVERVFGPCLPSPDREVIDALVAATDLYIWKLLRLDLGRSRDETLSVFHRLVQSTLVIP
jgi:AcrR family transcriptional regulator